MLSATIPSLAILKVNSEIGRDYIDSFVPFVAEVLRTAPQAEVSVPEVQSAINSSFGLTVPQGALSTILRRAAKRGYVERAQGIYRRKDDALATLNFSDVRDSVLRQYEGLIRKLLEYSGTRFGVEWTPEQADAAILAYLEKGSCAVLASMAERQLVQPAKQDVPYADFVVSSFVADMHKADHDGFTFLETIVKGSMLANVLLFPDLGGVQSRFGQVDVYFDTGFVLEALGLAGDTKQVARRELIDLLYEQNARLRVFEHTVDEVRGVLDAAAAALRSPTGLRRAHGSTIQYLVDSRYTAGDVELIIARLEKSLHALHIEVKPKPAYKLPLGIDEERLEAILQEEVRYQRPEARRYDVDSVAAVHRLRRGQPQARLESCVALFVTTNSALMRGSGRFFREQGDGYHDYLVPHLMLDRVLTTIVWLKKPLAAPDLPRKCIIADCYAAMNPSDRLWRRYLEEVDRLEKDGTLSEDDYYLLRFSTTARNTLMDLTLGDSEVFSEGTVQEVLKAAEAAARAETEAVLSVERLARESAERRAVHAEQLAAEHAASLAAERQAQTARVRIVSSRVGRIAALAVGIVGAVFLSVGIFLTLFFPALPGSWWLPATLALLGPLFLFLVLNVTCGGTLLSVTRHIEMRSAGFVERLMMRLVQAPPVVTTPTENRDS